MTSDPLLSDNFDPAPQQPPSNSSLEQFVLLAKGIKGAACTELISQVLETAGVHVFGELLAMPNIAEVRIV